MSNDIQLVKQVIRKAREIFGKDYGYIVDSSAEVHFREEENEELVLETVVFIADGNYQDEISISAYTTPIITLEEGLFESLADTEGFEQFLSLEEKSLSPLPEYFQERVQDAKKKF